MITINPGTNIQTTIDNNPAETVFQLQNGTHRIASELTLRAGLTLQGESIAAILSGSRELHSSGDATVGDFVADGATGRYYITGQTQQGTVNSLGQCQAGFPECHQPEDLWLDDVLQVPQTNITDVTQDGEWHFDYANNRIYIWGSPANKQVETSVTQKAIRANVNSCTLSGFTIEKFAVPFQSGAVEKDDGGTGWTVDGMLFRDCHGQAVRVGQDWTLSNSHITRCGQIGLGGGGTAGNKCTGILIDTVEIDNCGVSGINPGSAGGAMKIVNSVGTIMRDCNVHDNPGNGVWFDIDNEDVVLLRVTSTDNGYQGIFLEIGFRATVTDCVVDGCGFGRSNSSGFGAGILVAATVGVEITGCTVTNCHNGICAVQQNRGSGDDGGVTTEYVVRDLNVHDNHVVLLQTNGDVQRVGLFASHVPSGPGLFDPASNNTWTGNTYDLSQADDTPFAWAGSFLSFSGWQAEGFDLAASGGVRFYFDADNIPDVNPPLSAEWEVAGASQQWRRLNRSKQGTALATRNITSNTVLGDDTHWRSFVSAPLEAQTISGTVKGMLRCRQPNTAADERLQCIIKVVTNDGGQVRGTLLAADTGVDDPPAGEFLTSTTLFEARKVPRGWTAPGATLSSVACQDGDRLVVELGYRHMESGTARSGTAQFGDPTATEDLPEDELNQAEGVGWIEFSAAVTELPISEGTTRGGIADMCRFDTPA